MLPSCLNGDKYRISTPTSLRIILSYGPLLVSQVMPNFVQLHATQSLEVIWSRRHASEYLSHDIRHMSYDICNTREYLQHQCLCLAKMNLVLHTCLACVLHVGVQHNQLGSFMFLALSWGKIDVKFAYQVTTYLLVVPVSENICTKFVQ